MNNRFSGILKKKESRLITLKDFEAFSGDTIKEALEEYQCVFYNEGNRFFIIAKLYDRFVWDILNTKDLKAFISEELYENIVSDYPDFESWSKNVSSYDLLYDILVNYHITDVISIFESYKTLTTTLKSINKHEQKRIKEKSQACVGKCRAEWS